MHLIRASLCFMLILCGLSGCRTMLAPAPVRLMDQESGRTVELQPGQTLELTLTSNRTTGYSWAVMEDASPMLAREGPADYVRDAAATGRVGAGGHEHWRFRAVKPGQATLRLAYRRPWESSAAPAREVSWTIKVR